MTIISEDPPLLRLILVPFSNFKISDLSLLRCRVQHSPDADKTQQFLGVKYL